MAQMTDKPPRVMPSATPSEAEIAAWAALPRDEQIRRYRELFQHPDCNTFTEDTPEDILAAARQRVAGDRPRMLVCRTHLGNGVSFMTDRHEWHYRNLTPELHAAAVGEPR